MYVYYAIKSDYGATANRTIEFYRAKFSRVRGISLVLLL